MKSKTVISYKIQFKVPAGWYDLSNQKPKDIKEARDIIEKGYRRCKDPYEYRIVRVSTTTSIKTRVVKVIK